MGSEHGYCVSTFRPWVRRWLDRPLNSLTHEQYLARPAVTSPAAECHRPLTGVKIYSLVTGRKHRRYIAVCRTEVELATCWPQVGRSVRCTSKHHLTTDLTSLKITRPTLLSSSVVSNINVPWMTTSSSATPPSSRHSASTEQLRWSPVKDRNISELFRLPAAVASANPDVL